MGTVKSILKKIFPKVFLKKAFGLYNAIKIATIDKILFPEYPLTAGDFKLYRTGYPFQENNTQIGGISDKRVRSFMENWYNWKQEEFILEFNKACYIEPRYGWAIVPRVKLLYYSLGISRTWFLPKPNLLAFLRKSNVLHVPSVISLRDTGEENYFHFYNDVLAKIFFLKSHHFDVENLPIVISKNLWAKPFFQYYLTKSESFAKLNWLIQDTQFIKTDRAIFCKPLTHRKDLYDLIFAPIFKNISGSRRIFITRKKERLRFIENISDIDQVCRRYQIEFVELEELTLDAQVKLFSMTELIVGIHGSGLVNMFFRNEPCKVLEIFPPPEEGYLPFHYIMLADMKGFVYQGIIGEPARAKFSGGFYLHPTTFEQHLRALM